MLQGVKKQKSRKLKKLQVAKQLCSRGDGVLKKLTIVKKTEITGYLELRDLTLVFLDPIHDKKSAQQTAKRTSFKLLEVISRNMTSSVSATTVFNHYEVVANFSSSWTNPSCLMISSLTCFRIQASFYTVLGTFSKCILQLRKDEVQKSYPSHLSQRKIQNGLQRLRQIFKRKTKMCSFSSETLLYMFDT